MDIKPIRTRRDRKRPLTLAMAWKLHKGLGIPAECLIRQAA